MGYIYLRSSTYMGVDQNFTISVSEKFKYKGLFQCEIKEFKAVHQNQT